MSDETTITPALTAAEWAESEIESHYGHARTSLEVDHKGRIFAYSEGPGERYSVVTLNEAVDAEKVLHKVAALCLYGQRFGFTAEDVEFLRHMAAYWAKHGGFGASANGVCYMDADERSADLAARIAALLPPTP